MPAEVVVGVAAAFRTASALASPPTPTILPLAFPLPAPPAVSGLKKFGLILRSGDAKPGVDGRDDAPLCLRPLLLLLPM